METMVSVLIEMVHIFQIFDWESLFKKENLVPFDEVNKRDIFWKLIKPMRLFLVPWRDSIFRLRSFRSTKKSAKPE